jgi:hypothetical protein
MSGSPESLLAFLKESLMDSAIPEAGKYVREYLYKFRRNRGESVKLYVQRHRTLMSRLEKAMKVVEGTKVPLLEKIKEKVKSMSDTDEHEDEDMDEAQGATIPEPDDEDEDPWGGRYREDPEPDKRSEGSQRSKQNGWSWTEPKGWYKSEKKWTKSEWSAWREGKSSKKTPATNRDKLEALMVKVAEKMGLTEDVPSLCQLIDDHLTDLLPQTFTGWLLLQRSGLSPTERATIMAASKSLELPDIELALKNQWGDAELNERDAKSKSSFTAEEADDYEAEGQPASPAEVHASENNRNDPEADLDDLYISDVSDGED